MLRLNMQYILLLTYILLGLTRSISSEKDWWENIQLYQIYPRSFMDSDGDGIGDLKGITMKLDHLKESGVDAAWLSPIFQSPMFDFGYDISDFRAIQREYGTMEDFVELTMKAAQMGIKIVLDFVPNHTSDEHIWFKLSANRTKGYEDYYLWDEGKRDPENPEKKIRPNNWISLFRGSAWTWNEERQAFYYHQFLAKQPDLNMRNPKVVQEMKNIMKFWLDKGAAGFRVDALPHIFETDKDCHAGVYPDEPLSGQSDDPDDWHYLNHIYTTDQPETFDMVAQWRHTLDEYKRDNGGDTRIMMLEAYSSVELVMKYFGNKTHPGAQFPFNFNFIQQITKDSNAHEIKKAIDMWVDNLPSHIENVYNWVIGNHDNRRVASRYGSERVDGMTMLVLLLPGISVTYQGDEIAMEDQWLSWEDTVDPQACNTNPRDYEPHSRDPERTPFQWDDNKNAGFSTANKTWLPVAQNYKKLNLKAQKAAIKSHYKLYQQVSNLRKEKTFRDGSLKVLSLKDNIFAFQRALPGHITFVVLLNLSEKVEWVNLHEFKDIPAIMTVELANIQSEYQKGDIVLSKALLLGSYDSLVLRGIANELDYDY